MALFLFSVFLMFAVFQSLGITAPGEISVNTDSIGGLEAARELVETETKSIEDQLAELPAGHPGRPGLEANLAVAQDDRDKLDNVAGLTFESANDTGNTFGTDNALLDTTISAKWRNNSGLIRYKLQANSYKFSWLLIPLSLPFLWLLFAWKRCFNGFGHAVFATYSLAFMSLLFVTLSLLEAAGAPAGLWCLGR